MVECVQNDAVARHVDEDDQHLGRQGANLVIRRDPIVTPEAVDEGHVAG